MKKVVISILFVILAMSAYMVYAWNNNSEKFTSIVSVNHAEASDIQDLCAKNNIPTQIMDGNVCISKKDLAIYKKLTSKTANN